MREIENYLSDVINKNKYVELLNSVPQRFYHNPNYNPNPNHNSKLKYALVVGALALISFAFRRT